MISVQLELVSLSERYTVKVLGSIPGSSLILSCPRSKGKNILVMENQVVNVRLMLSTHVCAFSSKISKSFQEPSAHIYIAYPSYVETSEIRQAARTETRLISKIEPNTTKSSIPEPSSAIIIDLSLGGAKLVSKEDFGLVSQTMRLTCNLNVGVYSHILKLDCEIRSQEIQMLEQVQASMVDNDFLSKMGTEYLYVYGIRFINLEKESGIPLTAFVLETLRNKKFK